MGLPEAMYTVVMCGTARFEAESGKRRSSDPALCKKWSAANANKVVTVSSIWIYGNFTDFLINYGMAVLAMLQQA